jgi:hypothetical protein
MSYPLEIAACTSPIEVYRGGIDAALGVAVLDWQAAAAGVDVDTGGRLRALQLAAALHHARAACSAVVEVLLSLDVDGRHATPSAVVDGARALLQLEGWAQCPALDALLQAEARFYLPSIPSSPLQFKR